MENALLQIVGLSSKVHSENLQVVLPPGIEAFRRAGFAIHWLHPRSKRPIGKDWSTQPVASISHLRQTFRRGYNVGVRLGKWSKVGSEYLHVIDLDIRDDETGDEARQRLSELFPDVETYPVVQSGSGGESRHFYILSTEPFPSKKLAHATKKVTGADGKQHWAWEIDLFGTGKQVAIPPSIHPDTGNLYRWLRSIDFDLLDMGIGPFVPADYLRTLVGDVGDDQPADSERAAPLGLTIDEARAMLNQLPSAEWREDRDGWLQAGMALHHEFAGSDEAFKLWTDFSRLSEKFDPKDQRRVWKSFRQKAKPVRMATIRNAVREANLADEIDDLGDDEGDDFGDETEGDGSDDFADLLGGKDEPKAAPSPRQAKLNKADKHAELGHVPKKVARMNAKHAVAFINGKTVILTESVDANVSYSTLSDFHNWYENDRVSTDKATEPLSKAWMRHKMRREFPNGVVFAPGREVDGAYNHWRGFSVEPDPSVSCRLILRHIRHVICKDDPEAYRYLIGWLAHMIQRPWEKPGVAVVLRGAKGAGKDTVADYVGSLFPHHHVKIANQEHLVGRFNAHQERCLLLHVEEGFWAGNKQAEGTLKHLITSEKVFIEPKGLNGFHVQSVLRLFMSSNEAWVVPATEDERRYFVLDVSDAYSRRKASDEQRFRYFNPIRTEMTNGGRAALLHYLQTYDLSDFDVRAVPNTAALTEQKIQGLRNFERWWFQVLDDGDLPSAHLFEDRDWHTKCARIRRSDLQDGYEHFMASRRYDGEVLSASRVGRQLKIVCPDLETRRGRDGDERPLVYVLPTLGNCRRAFDNWIGSAVSWDEWEAS